MFKLTDFKYTVLFFIITTNLLAQEKIISFIALGDWGRDGFYLQKETAEQMGKYAEKNKTDFIISLGDNFYPYGINSVEDPKWQTSFEQIYSAPTMHVPWYVLLGNHDYGGNVQAQIDYSLISKRWKLPSRYYSFIANTGNGTEILFVITDTSPFIDEYKKILPDSSGANKNFYKNLLTENPDAQLRWIDSTLSVSDAKWKIVCGHHPVYSGGKHGNTAELVEKFAPLLDKYNVNLYLAGHDHDLQYLKTTGSNVNYVISGAGSKLRETYKTEYTVFSHSVNGFVSVTLSAEKIFVQFTDYTGEELFSFEIR